MSDAMKWKDRWKVVWGRGTAVRTNSTPDQVSSRRILKKKRYRETYQFICANWDAGTATAVKAVDARACRTLRRAGLIMWAEGYNGYAVAPTH